MRHTTAAPKRPENIGFPGEACHLQRVALQRRLLDTTVDAELGYRLVGVLVLLYGLPFKRIAHLALVDIHTDDAGTWLRIAHEPLLLLPRVAGLLDRPDRLPPPTRRDHGCSPAASPTSTQQLLTRTHRLGIHLRGGRYAALRDLLLAVPGQHVLGDLRPVPLDGDLTAAEIHVAQRAAGPPGEMEGNGDRQRLMRHQA